MLEGLKENLQDNTNIIKRTFKILVFTTIFFVLYGILISWLGLKLKQDDKIIYILQGLIVGPAMIPPYIVIIYRMKRHHMNVLNRHSDFFTA